MLEIGFSTCSRNCERLFVLGLFLFNNLIVLDYSISFFWYVSVICVFAVTHWPNSDTSQCQIGVIGISDGTLVDITFPYSKSADTPLQVLYDRITYTNGDTLSVVMNRYSTLQLQSKGNCQSVC